MPHAGGHSPRPYPGISLSALGPQHNNLYLMAMTNQNSNAAMVLLYLQRFAEVGIAAPVGAGARLTRAAQVCKGYFGELEEESIRDNFVILYELFDEMMDHGYPQVTEDSVLKRYIMQQSNKLRKKKKKSPDAQLPATATHAVSWRPPGIKHKKNEIFLDVVEKLNLLVSSTGRVLSSEILGAVKMRSFLSGMPELKLGAQPAAAPAPPRAASPRLARRVRPERQGPLRVHRPPRRRPRPRRRDGGHQVPPGAVGEAGLGPLPAGLRRLTGVSPAQCVRLARFENDRTISFIPPDGEFELMTYRLNTHVKPLIWVEAAVVPYSHSRIEYMIKTKSQFKARSIANNVEIVIPVPPDVDSPSFKVRSGGVAWGARPACQQRPPPYTPSPANELPRRPSGP